MATEGEDWTRAQLRDLRAERFRPAAIAAFLRASERRAGDLRRERPELARRERAIAAAGAAAWLTLAAARVEPFRSRLHAGLGGWAFCVLMLDRHLGMVETLDGRPRNLGPADAATLARAWLVPAVADRPTLALCAIGVATDVLDGRLARATRPTRLGRDFEPLVDAAFTAAALRGALRRGRLGRPAVTAEGLRLAAGAAYVAAEYFGRARAPEARVLRAGRSVVPLRTAALVLAACGRRRAADRLLLASTAAAVAAGVTDPQARRRIVASCSGPRSSHSSAPRSSPGVATRRAAPRAPKPPRRT